MSIFSHVGDRPGFGGVQDTIVAIRRGGDELVVANLESDKYPTVEFSTDPGQVSQQQRH